MDDFSVACSNDGTVDIVTVTGEIDLFRGPAIQEAINGCVDSAVGGVVMDYTEVDFIDSTGVAMLLRLHRRLQTRDCRMVIATDSARTLRMLELTGMNKLFAIRPTRETALELLAAPPLEPAA